MIEQGPRYALDDFVPFTAEVYFRLIERINESVWPLQLILLAAGIAMIVLAGRGRSQPAGMMLAAAWAWVAYRFFISEYSALNWAGAWAAAAFCIQAAAILIAALTGRLAEFENRALDASTLAGLAIAALGILVYPGIAPLAGRNLAQAEVFALHPDPTAVATLGIALIVTRGGPVLWIMSVIPIAWCAASTLTLFALRAPWWPVLIAVVILSLLSMAWKTARS